MNMSQTYKKDWFTRRIPKLFTFKQVLTRPLLLLRMYGDRWFLGLLLVPADGTRRSTPFAAQTAAEDAIRTLMDQGMERAEVMISGPGPGRDTALRAIRRSGVLLSFVRDVTPMPHNGCRPPKKRRV